MTVQQKLQPLYDVIDEECEALSEGYFRDQKAHHARLSRQPKPSITQEEFERLDKLAKDEVELKKNLKEGEEFEQLLSRQEAMEYVMARHFGIFEQRDLDALRAAESRRRKQRARQQELRRRGAYGR